MVSPTRTVIEAVYDSGRMYLKSSAPISREGDITKAVHDAFPDAFLKVLGHNTNLNAFTTESCDARRLGKHEAWKLLQQMGRMQLRSFSESHVTALCSSGLGVRSK